VNVSFHYLLAPMVSSEKSAEDLIEIVGSVISDFLLAVLIIFLLSSNNLVMTHLYRNHFEFIP
jgi:hypothetical protein